MNTDIFCYALQFLDDLTLERCTYVSKIFITDVIREHVYRSLVLHMSVSFFRGYGSSEKLPTCNIKECFFLRFKKHLCPKQLRFIKFANLSVEDIFDSYVKHFDGQIPVVIFVPRMVDVENYHPQWIQKLLKWLSAFEKSVSVKIVEIIGYLPYKIGMGTTINSLLTFIRKENLDQLVANISDEHIYLNYNEKVDGNWKNRIQKERLKGTDINLFSCVNLRPEKRLPEFWRTFNEEDAPEQPDNK